MHYSNNSVFKHHHYHLSHNKFVALASKQSTIVNLTKSVFRRTCEMRTCIVLRSKLRNGVRSLSTEKTLKYLQRERLTGFKLERFDSYLFIFQSTYKLTGSIKTSHKTVTRLSASLTETRNPNQLVAAPAQ